MRDDLIWLLTSNVGFFYKKPDYNSMRKSTFLQNAYAKAGWLALYDFIHRQPGENTLQKIEEFRHIVDSYSCISKNPETSYMFSVYYDVATQALDLLLGYIEGRIKIRKDKKICKILRKQ